MKLGSLFSGGGLGDFGFMAAGMEIAWQVEIDEYCQKILELRYPESKKYRDIKTLKGDDLEPVDILTGGFPCQPFSVAGKRKGKDDNRYLWPEMLRIIKECRPRWVIGENVVGITNLALDTVCADLEAEGYEVWPVVFPSHALGAWHKRDRIWIVCNSQHIRFSPGKITGCYLQRSDDSTSEQVKTCESSRPSEQYAPMADTNEHGSQGRECGELQECSSKHPSRESSTQNISDTSSQRCESRSNNTGKNGKETDRPKSDISSIGERWSSWWQSEPAVGRVANGVADRVHRLKMLGNGQCPVNTFLIGKFILEVEREYESKKM